MNYNDDISDNVCDNPNNFDMDNINDVIECISSDDQLNEELSNTVQLMSNDIQQSHPMCRRSSKKRRNDKSCYESSDTNRLFDALELW